jgi:hypothetical protein
MPAPLRRLCLALLLALACAGARAQSSGFKDPADGDFDLSNWLLERQGFLPVPIIITEPAVGYGGGAALLFFREPLGEAAQEARDSGRLQPPDILAVVLAATENGTRFGGAGGMLTSEDNRWRYRGGVARTHVNLDFYGAGGVLDTGERKIAYSLEGWASSQQVLRRLGESDNWLSARWIWLDLDSRFDPGQPQPSALPQVTVGSRSVTSSGLGFTLEHDSRDNIFTPSRGWTGSMEATFYSPGIGSDNSFQVYRGRVFSYVPVGESLVLAGRVDARSSRGEVPFYQLPYVDMRGIPIGRYQDQNVALGEVEARWNFTPRWAAVAFAGVARAWGTRTNVRQADNLISEGMGVRYLIARRLGMYVGADVARGPEDTAFYLQVGSAWR